MDNRVGIKFGKSLIFNIFAPSLGATSGFSWVSINKPLTPIAHAALDKEGINLDTEKLKSNFENWIASSKDVSFVIGGPDGLSNELIEESNFCWSLSQLTFPHAVVPILVLEQIYRAWSMTQNHPYHR